MLRPVRSFLFSVLDRFELKAWDVFLALLSGLLATLPFLNFSLAPLAWVALIPLGWAAWGKRPSAGAVLGLSAGLLNGYLGIGWLAPVTGLGYGLLGFYLSLYWSAWGAFVAFVSRRRPAWTWWSAPAAWVGLEFIRSRLFTGFPWNLLGVSQGNFLPLIQVAAWVSVTGVSFLVVLVNAALLQALILGWKARRLGEVLAAVGPLTATGVVILTVLFLGRRELRRPPVFPAGEGLRVGLIQGGIYQDLKWDPALAPHHFNLYLRLSRQAFAASPDVLIWPESALPYYLDAPGVMPALSELAAAGEVYLLIGADHRSPLPERRYFNSAFLIGPGGEIEGRYDKVHLVPYGEYTPLKRFFPFLARMVPWEDDFTPGAGLEPLVAKRPRAGEAAKVKIGVLICYEDIFPRLARKSVRQGAEILVNITNDAWFGLSAAPFQHAQAARFRAVENRVYLVRCANTGHSVIYDPWGRKVVEVTDERGRRLFVSAWAASEVFPLRKETLYRRYGDLFNYLCLGATVLAAGWSLRSSRQPALNVIR